MKRNTTANIPPRSGEEELAIEVSTHCNSSCLHCFSRTGLSRHSTLPVDLVRKIIREGYDAGYRRLHFTGGEPLLWEPLFDVLDYGFGVGYETIFMNTNGTLLTREIGNRLVRFENFAFSVSLDGPEALHDRIRGKGSHKKAIRGIENALMAGNNVTIFTTATKSLLPELPLFVGEVYKTFPDIDCLVLIQLIGLTNGVFPLTEELLEPEDFIRMVRMVALLNLGGFRTIVKKNPLVNVACRLMHMPWIPRVPPLYREGCLIVMANRNIGFVHSSKTGLGKYSSGMIRKVLASDRYRRTFQPDEITCPSCRYAQPCRENLMISPQEGHSDQQVSTPYCRRVLDGIDALISIGAQH